MRESVSVVKHFEWPVSLEKCSINAVHLPFKTKIEYFWIGICEYTSHWYEVYIQPFLCFPVRPQEHDSVFHQLSKAFFPFRSICEEATAMFDCIITSRSVQISFFQMRYLLNIKVFVITLPHNHVLTMNQLYTELRGSDTVTASPLMLNSAAAIFSVAC